MVLHELDDDPEIMGVVLDGDHAHDVRRVLRIRVLAVFVSQEQTRVSLSDLITRLLSLESEMENVNQANLFRTHLPTSILSKSQRDWPTYQLTYLSTHRLYFPHLSVFVHAFQGF